MGHPSWIITAMMVVILETFCLLGDTAKNATFDENYKVLWGNHHISFLNQNREVQLMLDKSSGAGFVSKSYFGSGIFQMKIKLHKGDTAGLVTTFYLFRNTSEHDEIDFEFTGNRPGKPVYLQTNVHINHVGNREQRVQLWFDPSADFHNYKMLWNNHLIVLYVDDIPIRVHKNHVDAGKLERPMQVMVSFWDASDWATDGGRTKTNYSNAPFHAHFQDFSIDGCVSQLTNPNKDCNSEKHFWNAKNYTELSPQQLKAYQDARKKYVLYDFCTDKKRNPSGPPPECIA